MKKGKISGVLGDFSTALEVCLLDKVNFASIILMSMISFYSLYFGSSKNCCSVANRIVFVGDIRVYSL